jgi:F0F1-type ATP synthase assembly protein I
MRYFFAGTQLAVTVVVCTAIGYWVDKRMGWSPWGLITGSLIGIILGMLGFLEAYDQNNRKSS